MAKGVKRGRFKYNVNIKNICIIIIIFITFFPLVSPININSSNVEPVTLEENLILGAYREFGKGRCVFYGDATCFNIEGLGNCYGDYSVEEMNSARQFALNIFSWVGQGGKQLLVLNREYKPFQEESNRNEPWDLPEFLIKNGYRINYSDYESADISYELLKNHDAFLLLEIRLWGLQGETKEKFGFSKHEIFNITKFVHEGGGLFVLGNVEFSNDEFLGIAGEIYNPLINEFGASLNSNRPDIKRYWQGRTWVWNYKLTFSSNILTDNVSALPFGSIYPFSIKEPTKPLVSLIKNHDKLSFNFDKIANYTTKGVLAACVNYSKGRAVFTGLNTPFLNYGYTDCECRTQYTSEEKEGSKTFIRNIAKWLGGNTKRILIDLDEEYPGPGSPQLIYGVYWLDSELKNAGYNITYHTRFYNEISFENISEFDMVFLLGTYGTMNWDGAIYRWGFSEREINNITKFVAAGGGLLVMGSGERKAPGAANDIYNPLATKFGIRFNEDTVKKDILMTCPEFRS